MTRWVRISLYALLATGLLLVVATVAIVAAGPDFARGLVEDAVSEATGREFAIHGEFEPEWGRHLAVTAADLSLANAEWADQPQMLTVGRLRVVVDLWSLLAGPVYLERIEVENLELHLLGREDEPPNWAFQPEDGTPPPRPEDPDDEAGPGLLVGFVQADDVRVHLDGPNLDRPMVLTIRQLRQTLEADEMIELGLEGDINEEPLAIRGRLGPLPSLLAGREISYDLETRLGPAVLRTDLFIDDVRSPRQPRGTLTLAGPDIGAFSEKLGLGRIGEGDFNLTASLTPEDVGVALRTTGRLGRMNVDAQGSIRDIPGLDGLAFNAEVSGPELGRLMRIFGLEAPNDPFEFRTNLRRDGKNFRIDEARFSVADAVFELSAELNDFPTLDEARIDLHIEGTNVEKARTLLQIPGFASGPFEVEGHLGVNPDGIEEIRLTSRTDLGEIRVDGTLGDPETYVGTALAIDIRGPSLERVGTATSIPHFPDDPFSVSGSVAVVAEGEADVSDAVVRIGEDRGEVAGRVVMGHGGAGTDLRVSAAGEDLAEVLAMTGVTKAIPAEAYTVSGRLRFEEEGLRLSDVEGTVAQTKVRGEGLVAFSPGVVGTDLRVRVEGPDLSATLVMPKLRDYAPAEAFTAEGRLRVTEAGIAMDEISGEIAGASLKGRWLIALAPELVGSYLQVSASGPDLSRLVPELPDFSPPPGPFELEGRMERGRDYIALENTRLVYGGARGHVDARFGLPFEAGVMRFDVQLEGPDATVLPIATGFEPDPLPFTLTARGERQDDHWRIDGSELRLGDASARLSGELSGMPDAPDGQLDFNAAAPSLAALGTLDGTRLIDLPLEISAALAGSEGRLELTIPSARLGETDLSGEVDFRPGDVPRLDVDLHSTRLNTRELRREEPTAEEAAEPASEKKKDRLIPDTPLPLERMRRLDASVAYSADELVLATVTARDLRLRVTMLEGALRVEEMGFSGEVGALNSTLELVPEGAAANAVLKLEATDLRTVFFARARDTSALPLFSANVDLRGRGATWRELAASLDGHGWFTSKDGQLPNKQFTGLLLGDFVTEVFTTVNPFAETEPVTRIQCVAVPFVVEQGTISSLPTYVMRTDKLDIAAWGAVDLATEKVDYNFKTQPRKGLGLSASQMVNPFMKIEGTMSSPRLTLDPSGTLVTGTATVITGGAWLLFKGALDSVLRSKDPCGEVMQTHAKELEKRGR